MMPLGWSGTTYLAQTICGKAYQIGNTCKDYMIFFACYEQRAKKVEICSAISGRRHQ